MFNHSSPLHISCNNGLLVIRGLSEVGFVVCVVGGDPRQIVFWFGWCWSGSLEKKEKWGRLFKMCIYQHCIMALMTVYEGLGLLIARQVY